MGGLNCSKIHKAGIVLVQMETSHFPLYSPEYDRKKIVMAKVLGAGAWFLAHMLVFSNIIWFQAKNLFTPSLNGERKVSSSYSPKIEK